MSTLLPQAPGEIQTAATATVPAAQRQLQWVELLYVGAAFWAVLTYLYGLGDIGIPANGDENVYIHIARMTAASGHWLPLAGDIEQVRNTKPPLLFWQAIFASGWGAWWTLWWIRLPGALYTLGTATVVVLLLRRLTGQLHAGLLAAVLYLAYYSTYRYGRPLLTDAPETFWLCLPAAAIIGSRGALLSSRFAVPLATGLCVGIACLYKSFALLLPVGLMLGSWHYVCHGRDLRHWLTTALPGMALTAALALAIFLLWPLLDPDGQQIWHDFVVKENAGKFHEGVAAYLRGFFAGRESIWYLLGSLLANTGLLAPLLVAQGVDAWRSRRTLTREELLLWVWLAAFVVAFALPSQRSGRYLLPAMPAVAALAALAWARLPRAGIVVSAALVTLVAGSLIYAAVVVTHAAPDLFAVPWLYWVLLAVILAAGIASLARPALAAATTPVLALGLLMAMGLQLHAYSAPAAIYTAATRAQLAGQAVFVPCDFLAAEEAHRFILPGADVRSYEDNANFTPGQLAQRYRFFAAYVPLDETPGCAGCRVLDMRLAVRGRHTSHALGHATPDALLKQLFVREVLFESPAAPRELPPPAEACAG